MVDSDNAPILDLPSALARLGGDRSLLRDLAVFYLEDALDLLRQLEKGLNDNDVELVMRCAHNLKSLSSNFDSHRASAVALEAEQYSRQGKLNAVAALLPQLEFEVERVIQALTQQLLDVE
ncbi:MAG TPA: Hpt domain-containing protein [Planctomicrobium sp.]|nr:Hpt domain-containing protein [Planctomicrobium sp.]